MKHIIDPSFLSLLEACDLKIDKAFQGLYGGNRKSREAGSSPEFYDFREYTPGDDLRRVDWNQFLRFEKLFLKLFVDERQLHHRIYLDTSSSMDWGEEKKSLMALRLAASLGYLSVKALDRVSFFALSEKNVLPIGQAVNGKESFFCRIEDLENVSFAGECRMDLAFQSCPDLGGKNGLSIILSDFFSDEDWKKSVDTLLSAGRDVALIRILSRDEVDPQLGGKLFLRDVESQEEGDEKNLRMDLTRSSLAAYQKALAFHRKSMADFCRSRGILLIEAVSDEPLEKVLFHSGKEGGWIQ